jgi:hypothetical protein
MIENYFNLRNLTSGTQEPQFKLAKMYIGTIEILMKFEEM